MSVTEALSHLGFGLSVWNYSKFEHSHLDSKDGDPVFAGFCQSIQTSAAISQINKTFTYLGKSFRLSGWTSFTIEYLPIVIAVAKQRFDPKTWQGRILTFGHLHLGKLSFVINCVSIVVMPILGAPVLLSVCSFTAIVYGFSYQNKWIPKAFNDKAVPILRIIFVASRILQGNWLERGMTCFEMVVEGYCFYKMRCQTKNTDFSDTCFPLQKDSEFEVDEKSISFLIKKEEHVYLTCINNDHTRVVLDKESQSLQNKVLSLLVEKRTEISRQILKLAYVHMQDAGAESYVNHAIELNEYKRIFGLPEDVEKSPVHELIDSLIIKYFFYDTKQSMIAGFKGEKELKDVWDKKLDIKGYNKENIVDWTQELLKNESQEEIEKLLEIIMENNKIDFNKEDLYEITTEDTLNESTTKTLKKNYVVLLLLDWDVLRFDHRTRQEHYPY